MIKLRPNQQAIIAYEGGRLGVSAVPGSGKTFTLSQLAARLVAETDLQDGQEILVVTLVNSAAGNFSQQVSSFLKARGLLPGYGYRIRTLHGLASDIVRERPALAGLGDQFTIIDERDAGEILQSAVDAWILSNPGMASDYLESAQLENKRTVNYEWPQAVLSMANNFIRQAKDLKQSPESLRAHFTEKDALPLARMCLAIYEAYERGLRYRGAVDFQDLIRLALHILEQDPDYLNRLRQRWPIVLEDEAQDSSQLQEEILRLIIGKEGNWVRVGDPNQAIFETFTTADPRLLRNFLKEKGVTSLTLPHSGRSQRRIINLANTLIEWSLKHPIADLRARKPLDKPLIKPVPRGDPQPNPPDNLNGIVLYPERLTPDEETKLVVESLRRWLPDHPDRTAAVLVPRNARGTELVATFKELGIAYVENLNSTSSTRAVVGALGNVLKYLSDPKDASALATAYRVWQRDTRSDEDAARAVAGIAGYLKKIRRVEDFLWPRLSDWLAEFNPAEENESLRLHLSQFRQLMQRWQDASILPIDQLILTISADLFDTEADLATAYSVALYLRRFADSHPEARLPEFTDELGLIARNRRKFSGLGDEDTAFDPDQHRGKVTVTTMHKAKGLEWDRVYLMSVNNYDFPSAEVDDSFIGERYYIRDKLNLEAEALSQLQHLLEGGRYHEGKATQTARLEYAGERLRLLYVAITRARRELIITWNTGRYNDKREALPLAMLRGHLEKERLK